MEQPGKVVGKVFIQIWWKDQKFIDKQKLIVQHDQTSFTRNVKEISLSKKKSKLEI